MESQTTGSVIKSLVQRAGLSVRSFAQACGYKNGSSVQRYLEASFNRPIKAEVAKRMTLALEGRGNPPIQRSEIVSLIEDQRATLGPANFDADILSKLVLSLAPLISDRSISEIAVKEFATALFGALRELSNVSNPSDVVITQAAVRAVSELQKSK